MAVSLALTMLVKRFLCRMKTSVGQSWGLSPAVLPILEQAIIRFCNPADSIAPATGEVYLPVEIANEVQAGRATVDVLPVSSLYGVTYQEDLPTTRAALQRLHDDAFITGYNCFELPTFLPDR